MHIIGVGLLGKHVARSCNIYVTKEEQIGIASSLVRLGRALTNKRTLDVINHSTTIAPKELKVNDRVG